jgi:hypothetical protein
MTYVELNGDLIDGKIRNSWLSSISIPSHEGPHCKTWLECQVVAWEGSIATDGRELGIVLVNNNTYFPNLLVQYTS